MMAWLNAVPKPPPGSKRAEAEKDAPRLSRLDQCKKDGITPKMPPNPMPHIVSRLIEIGITETTGMGPAPLSWRELEAWQFNTRVRLHAWEARLLRHLSLAYLSESRASEVENHPAPWRGEITAKEREVDEAKTRLLLG